MFRGEQEDHESIERREAVCFRERTLAAMKAEQKGKTGGRRPTQNLLQEPR